MTRAKFVVSSLQFSSSDITFINFMKLLLLCMTVILLLLNWKMGYFSSLSSRLICFFLSSSSLLFFSCVCSCCYWKSSSLCERRIYGQAKASIAIANINLFETQHIIAMSRDWAVCAQERQIFSRRVMSSCFCRNEQTQNNMKKKKRILSGILVLASGDSRSEICFYLLAVDIRVHKESSRPSYVGCVCWCSCHTSETAAPNGTGRLNKMKLHSLAMDGTERAAKIYCNYMYKKALN